MLKGLDLGMDFPLETGRGHLFVNFNSETKTILVGMENNGPNTLWGMVQHIAGVVGPLKKQVSNTTSLAGVGKWFDRHKKGKMTALAEKMKAEGYVVPTRLYNGMHVSVGLCGINQEFFCVNTV